MSSYKIDVRLEGDKFFPSKLQSKMPMPLNILSESGKIAVKGRNAGKEALFGMANFEFPVGEKDVNETLWECNSMLQNLKSSLDECGVDEITIDVGNYDASPLDIRFSKDLMNAFNALNATLEFHTVVKEKELNNTVEELIMKAFKKKSTMSTDDFAKILSLVQGHPSLAKTSALSYLLFLRSKNSTFDSEEQNHLNEFDAFCQELV